jgi:hypothetical protein
MKVGISGYGPLPLGGDDYIEFLPASAARPTVVTTATKEPGGFPCGAGP